MPRYKYFVHLDCRGRWKVFVGTWEANAAFSLVTTTTRQPTVPEPTKHSSTCCYSSTMFGTTLWELLRWRWTRTHTHARTLTDSGGHGDSSFCRRHSVVAQQCTVFTCCTVCECKQQPQRMWLTTEFTPSQTTASVCVCVLRPCEVQTAVMNS